MMTKLSDTQRAILQGASQHALGLARAPRSLPAAARSTVFRSMLGNNLLTEISATQEMTTSPGDRVGPSWVAM